MSGHESVTQRLVESCREEHEELLDGLDNKTAWSKEADLGYGNQVVSSAQDNRTVLELVQNARDAIIEGDGDGRVSVIVGPESLMVANTGSPFRLDEDDVFKAVTSLGRSTKAQDRGSIGEKGVGLKSVLQLSEQFSIYSEVGQERISAHFSRARTARMILAMYGDLLEHEAFERRLEPPVDDALVAACRSLAPDIDDGPIPDHIDVGEIRDSLLEGEQEPPSPSSLLSDLPRLSLFRYPFPDTSPEDRSPLRSRLVSTDAADATGDDPFGDDLRAWMDEQGGTFTTVVELDYVDTDWRQLLDDVDGTLTGASDEALSTFRDHRSAPTTGPEDRIRRRKETFWEESTDISPETLILLGNIEQLNLVRVIRGADGTLKLDNHRQITVDPGDTTPLPDAPAVTRRTITYTVGDPRDDETDSHEREFRQYTRIYDHLTDADGSERDTDKIHVLFERPEMGGGWTPTSKPLYLYYPIDEVETPFPFVVHAPFRVGFDRRSLAEERQNRRILEEIPGLVTTAATHLASRTSSIDPTDRRSFAWWMPWLVTPLAPPDGTDGPKPVMDAVEDTLGLLRNCPIVPTDADGPQQPTETLYDPEHPSAFEALRREAPEAPIPAREAIASGIWWRGAVGDTDGSARSGFRLYAARIGLTDVLDRPFGDGDDERGCIDVLCECWGAGTDTTGEIDWAVPVEDIQHATEYFESICGVLLSASEGDDLDVADETVAKKAAKKLGDARVPLLPAEAHRDSDRGDPQSITHLVRARSRHDGHDGRGTRRSERIVFRRTSGDPTGRSIISDLPTPPSDLRVFVVPFRPSWTGPLEGFNWDWGTRNLDSPAEFYRRVAAEAGGYSGEATSDPDIIGYLAELYETVTRGQIAGWLQPEPHRHHRYGELEETLEGGKVSSLPSDYDDYLERRYVQQVRLPVANPDTRGGPSATDPASDRTRTETRPAERLSFGSEWAAEFLAAADALEAAGSGADRFGGQDGPEDSRVASFRRWAAAIRLASDSATDGIQELVPPDDDHWRAVFGEDWRSEESDRIRCLDVLIHLGVQVGPRIEWRWTLPTRGRRDEEAGTLTVSDAQAMARGEPPEGSGLRPPRALIERYRDTIWRSDNHPAFSAGHSTGCGNRWLDPNLDDWVGDYPSEALVPMWWYFPDLPDVEQSAARDYRDAILLMWPELSDGVVEVAWLCSRWHSFNTSTDDGGIPALGVVQLSDRRLWPVEGMFEEEAGDDRLTFRSGERVPASRLVLHDEDHVRGAVQYLPRVDVDTLEGRLTEAIGTGTFDGDVIDLPAALRSFGIRRLDALTPPMAAERLEWFISQFDIGNGTANGGRTFTVAAGWSNQAMTVPTDALMRRLVDDVALSRELDEREAKRRWIRRDIHHIGTCLPVTEGHESKGLCIGDDRPPGDDHDTVVFTRPLSRYSRERLVSDGRRFIERPADETELAHMLGVDDDPVDFGIVTETDPPSPRPVHGAGLESGSDRLEELRSQLRDRQEYLLAGYLENATAPDLQSVHDDLSAVSENPIAIVERGDGDDVRRNSAEWRPSAGGTSPHIALFRDSVDRYQGEDGEIPLYLAADGLVQVIEQFDLRDTFENVLFKDETALEDEYSDALEDIRREIVELRTRRLEQVFRTLEGLVDTHCSDVALPSPDGFDVDPRRTLSAARRGAGDGRYDGGHPLLDAWSERLIDGCGLDEDIAVRCIAAAATDDHETRQRITYQLAREDVLDIDELVGVGHRWEELDTWPHSHTTRPVESYIRAVDRVRRFWEALDEYEDEGEDAIERAVRDTAASAHIPGPRRRVAGLVRDGSVLGVELRALRLGHLPYVEMEPLTLDRLVDGVSRWVDSERDALQRSDNIYRDPDIDDLLKELTAAVSDPETAKERVDDALDSYGQESGGARTVTGTSRSDLTANWIANEVKGVERIATGFEPAPTLTEGSSPDIGESTGVGHSHVNAEIDARGREGELICLDRAWRRFRHAPKDVRTRILEMVEEWRAYEYWRLESVDSIADSLAGPVIESDQGREDHLGSLDAAELEGTPDERATFHALFDTSMERGPGFDLIDPFAAMPDDEDLGDWAPDWMRRVEAKAVDSGRIHNGRIKLTGNELRMALRPGPSTGGPDIPTDDADHRYRIRLVGFPTDWRDESDVRKEVQLFDIEDITGFLGVESGATEILEKLRGGSFYITFQT